MNIQEIKTKLGVETLPLNQVVTEAGEQTSWFKHWDNDTRIAILVHAETLELIKTDPTLATLGLTAPQTKMSKSSGKEYTAIYICNYENSAADVTL